MVAVAGDEDATDLGDRCNRARRGSPQLREPLTSTAGVAVEVLDQGGGGERGRDHLKVAGSETAVGDAVHDGSRGPVLAPERKDAGLLRSGEERWIDLPDLGFPREELVGDACGAPHTPTTASPMNFSTTPPKRSISARTAA